MTPDEFKFVSTLLKSKSGLTLKEDKAYLIESRLVPVARANNLKGLEELISKLRMAPSSAMVTEVVEAMTTNESFFFRDTKPFDLFKDLVLPQLLENRKTQKSFKIWCAAASSGQEPYSLAILLAEAKAKLNGWRYNIIGTDISKDILKKAELGLYSQFEVQRGLPIQLLLKYFKKEGEHWQVNKDIRDQIVYKYFNLLDNPSVLGKFDVVFCRNVLIYFDQETKGQVLDRIATMMPDDGLLFLGGAETVLGISDSFKPVPGARGIYMVNR